MKITKLRRMPRAPADLAVEIDGARFAVLPEARVNALGLREGLSLGEATLDRLRAAADAEAAVRRAVRLMAARPRASQELLRRLRRAGHSPPAAAEAVGRLEERGLLDDDAFARHFVRVRTSRGHGEARLLRDLLALGVDRRVAEVAVAEVLEIEGVDPDAELERLARRRLGQLRDLPAKTRLRRTVMWLARRGYPGGKALGVVRQLLEGAEA